MKTESLIDIVQPKGKSTILIYDVHASESGALAILDDLYKQIKEYNDKTVKWVFVVSTPNYKEEKNIIVKRFPWVKKSWFHRLFFNKITTRKILKEYNPDKIFSLQNEAISFYKKEQYVYLHLPFVLSEYKFKLRRDGKQLWMYQHILKKPMLSSLKKAKKIIVQTNWMKNELNKQENISLSKIVVNYPDVKLNDIRKFKGIKDHIVFFYPATAFNYKNHITILKAINYLKENGLSNYEVVFTIKSDENKYSRCLYEFSMLNELNVKFNGSIPRSEVFKMYEKSILLFPSFVESFGLPLLEAKETNSPIVASDYPFSREILKNYDRVQFFSGDNYIDMAHKILEILKRER